jgi:Putative auto-transporter adhesin, head GIN domain
VPNKQHPTSSTPADLEVIMSRLPAALCLAAFATLAAAAAEAKSEERDVPPFTAVHTSAGIRAIVVIGPKKPLLVEGSDETVARIETRVEDGHLYIGFKKNSWGNWTNHDPRVTVTAPELRELSASGGARIEGDLAKNPKVEELVVEVSGGGEAALTNLDSKKLDASASGGATLDFTGRAEELRLELSGGAQLHGKGLAVKDLRISGSGGAVAKLSATGEARGSLSGGSVLHLRGGAKSHVKTSGGSEVDSDE